MTSAPYPVGEAGSERPSVAVIGSGIAGLSAAYLLSRKYRVCVFEREERLGMDAHSLDAHGARMDIPLRVFSESYYPNLCRLYRHLGIEYGNADYSFSVTAPAASTSAFFRYFNAFFWGMAVPLPALVDWRLLPKYLRLGYQLFHFIRHSPTYIARPGSEKMTLTQFLSAFGYSAEFATDLLLPMLSVVCTCSYAAVEAYPARLVVDYFGNKYGLSGAQCRAHKGTREIVSRLAAPVDRAEVAAEVLEVLEGADGGAEACVRWRDAGGGVHSQRFDQVVLATQANVSRALLHASSEPQIAALKRFPYERKRVVLHTDSSLMPASRCDWSPLNISLDPEADAAAVTVWMNRIDGKLREELSGPIFQSWNPAVEPRADTVKADYYFERPVVTFDSVAAMQDLQQLQGVGRVWFVGAYSLDSMPLLENGVKSSIEVASRLGVDASDIAFNEDEARRPPPSRLAGASILLPLGALAAVALASLAAKRL